MFKRLCAFLVTGFILLSALTATAGDVSNEDVTTHDMEANIAAVLEVLIDSLYTQKQVFLRELISNAVDALDKLRYLALQNADLLPDIGEAPLSVRVSFDSETKTLHIADNGVGMTEEEMVKFLGSIAESGTRRFAAIKTASEERAKSGKIVQNQDTDLIGQFGVGFYSAFLVARDVDVESVSYTQPGKAHFWRSNGTSSFTTGPIDLETYDPEDPTTRYDDFIRKHGTHIILHLDTARAQEAQITDIKNVADLASKFSAYLQYPIYVFRENKVKADDDSEEETVTEWTRVSDVEPLWRQDPSTITADEYRTFYEGSIRKEYFNGNPGIGSAQHWSHFKVEGSQGEFRALLYLPDTQPIDLGRQQRTTPGVALYARRVFVASADKEGNGLLPSCLNFIRGIADADQIDIHVSRELLQNNNQLIAMRRTLLRKAMGMLNELVANDPAEKYGMEEILGEGETDKLDMDDDEEAAAKKAGKFGHLGQYSYRQFWSTFGGSIKSCVAEELENERVRNPSLELLRFDSTWRHEQNEKRKKLLEEAKQETLRLREEMISGVTGDLEEAKKQAEEMYPMPDEKDAKYAEIPLISLRSYVQRMPSWQKDIYAVFGMGMDVVTDNPALEMAKKRGIEVLLSGEPFDEVLVRDFINQYDGHYIWSVLDEGCIIPKPPGYDEGEDEDPAFNEFGAEEMLKPITSLMQRACNDMDVKRVVVSPRLVETPALIVSGRGGFISATREKLLKLNGGGDPRLAEVLKAERVMEVNPKSPVIRALNKRVISVLVRRNMTDGGSVYEPSSEIAARLLADAGSILSGIDLDDAYGFALRLNSAVGYLTVTNATDDKYFEEYSNELREQAAEKNREEILKRQAEILDDVPEVTERKTRRQKILEEKEREAAAAAGRDEL